jgi:hypothetical protein
VADKKRGKIRIVFMAVKKVAGHSQEHKGGKKAFEYLAVSWQTMKITDTKTVWGQPAGREVLFY